MPSIGRHVSKLSGYAPALPTPFKDDGAVDLPAFERFCAMQIGAGATALVVCGTTGEAPTLTPQEQRELIRAAVQTARGRVPVIAGAGSNSTAHAIELSQDAEKAGADAILSVVPYYNRPTQTGLFKHFRAIAGATGLPLILYNVPSRTVTGLADDTVARLAETPQFIGLKDVTGDLPRLDRLKAMVDPRFRFLSGDDTTALAFIMRGGHGCISVTSNVMPGLCRATYLAAINDQAAVARRPAEPITQLTETLFRETSPAPLKYALSLLGWMSPTLRLPLVQPGATVRAEIAAMLKMLADQYSDHLIDATARAAHSTASAVA